MVVCLIIFSFSPSLDRRVLERQRHTRNKPLHSFSFNEGAWAQCQGSGRCTPGQDVQGWGPNRVKPPSCGQNYASAETLCQYSGANHTSQIVDIQTYRGGQEYLYILLVRF